MGMVYLYTPAYLCLISDNQEAWLIDAWNWFSVIDSYLLPQVYRMQRITGEINDDLFTCGKCQAGYDNLGKSGLFS